MNRYDIVYQILHFNVAFVELRILRADNARYLIVDGGGKKGGKHKMYSNGYLNLSNVRGLGLFSSKEGGKKHTQQVRAQVYAHAQMLSHTNEYHLVLLLTMGKGQYLL